MKPLFPKPTRKEKLRKPLKRSRMKRKTSRRVQQKTEEARNYHAWLSQRPCVCEDDSYSCDGPIQISHIRNRTGLGLKPNDLCVLPKCRAHHEAWESRRGYFRGWTQEQRMYWADRHIGVALNSYRMWRGMEVAA